MALKMAHARVKVDLKRRSRQGQGSYDDLLKRRTAEYGEIENTLRASADVLKNDPFIEEREDKVLAEQYVEDIERDVNDFGRPIEILDTLIMLDEVAKMIEVYYPQDFVAQVQAEVNRQRKALKDQLDVELPPQPDAQGGRRKKSKKTKKSKKSRRKTLRRKYF